MLLSSIWIMLIVVFNGFVVCTSIQSFYGFVQKLRNPNFNNNQMKMLKKYKDIVFYSSIGAFFFIFLEIFIYASDILHEYFSSGILTVEFSNSFLIVFIVFPFMTFLCFIFTMNANFKAIPEEYAGLSDEEIEIKEKEKAEQRKREAELKRLSDPEYIKAQNLVAKKDEQKEFLSKYELSRKIDLGDTILGVSQKEKTLIIYTNLCTANAAEAELEYSFIPFASIIECEIMEDQTTIQKGGIGRAVVGGLIAGGAGAIVGAATRKSSNVTDSLAVRIITNDISKPLYEIRLIERRVKRDSEEYKKQYDKAQKIYALIIAIINQ